MHQRNIKLRQQSALPTPERCRICGEAIAPAQTAPLYSLSRGLEWCYRLPAIDAHRAFAVKNDVIGQSVSTMVRLGRDLA